MADLLEFLDVVRLPLTFADPVEDVVACASADTAGCTFTARFIHCEFKVELGDVNHAVIFIHDNHTAGSHHRADGLKAFVVDRRIKECRRNTSAGRASGLRGFKFLAAGNTAADIVDDVAQGRSHRDFNQTGVVDFAGQREHLGSL